MNRRRFILSLLASTGAGVLTAALGSAPAFVAAAAIRREMDRLTRELIEAIDASRDDLRRAYRGARYA